MDHNIVGKIGEKYAAEYLKERGFTIIDRNYRKKWGEIDIIAKKDNTLHFVEVKTVSRKTSKIKDNYEPEDNVHTWKKERLGRIIRTYLLDRKLEDIDFQVDVISVILLDNEDTPEIRFLEDIDI